MTYVPVGRLDAYRAAGDRVLGTVGDLAHVEAVLVEPAASGSPPAIAGVSGHGWLETDEAHERAHAEAVLERERWWRDEFGDA
jgi:hypothetical protein